MANRKQTHTKYDQDRGYDRGSRQKLRTLTDIPTLTTNGTQPLTISFNH